MKAMLDKVNTSNCGLRFIQSIECTLELIRVKRLLQIGILILSSRFNPALNGHLGA